MFPVVFAIGGTAPAIGTSAAIALAGLGALLVVTIVGAWLCFRHIPNEMVGVVEKLWSRKGSVPEGRIIALDGEAGYQAHLLRGGLHFGLWRWQYRVHKVALVTIPQGQIGYVYARDGDMMPPSQTLARVVHCNNFQDARAFLGESAANDEPAGQRGRQRGVLREGVYAINPALFVVMTEDAVLHLPHLLDARESTGGPGCQTKPHEAGGFRPISVGAAVTANDPLHPDKAHAVDWTGIVTVHAGPSLPVGEIIAPPVGTDSADVDYHNNYQDPEA